MRLVLALIAILSCAPLGAHDFWIEPTTFRPEAGETFNAALLVGEHFDGDVLSPRALRIDSFVVRTARGEQPVSEGMVEVDGPAVIGYRGKPTAHNLTSEKFAGFLREEGIRGITPDDGIQRERFYRFAKSLVNGRQVNTQFGWRFELVMKGEAFQLLYEGKPLRDVRVTAMSRDGAKLVARTDAVGMVRFKLGSGVWLVKAVHVIPAPKDSGFDWESLWASMTFEM